MSSNSAQIVAVAPVTLEHVCKACGARSRAVVGGSDPEETLRHAVCPMCKKRGERPPFGKDPPRLFAAVTTFGLSVGVLGVVVSVLQAGALPPLLGILALLGLPVGVLYALSARLLMNDVRERRELDGRMQFLPPPPSEGPYRSAR